MDAIYNAIKNEFDNRIKNYEKRELFNLNLIDNLGKRYAIKYSGLCQEVEFSIEVDYIDEQIIFSHYIGESYSKASFEVTDFIRWIVKMPKEDLIKKITFNLSY
ncbi:hypothetical protein [Flavobacterium johnsoniae]|uniref:Uncharacterized protein n=1 Tax=Flavobacterium johnsoniae TaxID=986 RepID=A0A1J7C3M8_FLAJO|nr:hypothetical protein [Flavobacterium johnsoniae]OIV40305.1 hypothetical protein BKM63_20415 [Flavobacterium johnsoniae]